MWINFTLALSPQKFPLQADTFCVVQSGTAEKQKWALILPSSLSHSVTSSAGMTAYLVLLCTHQSGILSRGRDSSPPQEQNAQKEEAFARATVALTRATADLHNHGTVGYARSGRGSTIMGCLKYGVCFSGVDAGRTGAAAPN